MSWLSQFLNQTFSGGNVFEEALGLAPEVAALTAAAFLAPEVLPEIGAGLGTALGIGETAAAEVPLDIGAADLGSWLTTTDFGPTLAAAEAPAGAATPLAEAAAEVSPVAQQIGGMGLPSWFSDAGLTAPGGGGGFGALPPISAPAATPGAAAAPLSLGGWGGGDWPTSLDLMAPGTTLDTGAPLAITPGSPGVPMATAAPGAAAPAYGPVATTLSNWTGISPGALTTAGAIAGPAAGALGLGYNVLQGMATNKQLSQLAGQEAGAAATAQGIGRQAQVAAAPLIQSGEELMNVLTTGQLPPAFESQVDQSIASAKAQITQGYASRGMSTDPNQNSALAQDLANVDLQANSLRANLETTLAGAGQQWVQTANQLLAQGLSADQLAAQIPITMQELQMQLNQMMANAISSFASAFSGGGARPQVIQIGGGATTTPITPV